jgi:excisionase family DNA binding protein
MQQRANEQRSGTTAPSALTRDSNGAIPLMLSENRIDSDDDLGLMPLEEVAVALGIAPQTLRNRVAKRSIPFIRIGRRTMFRRASLQAWLLAKETPCQ